MKQWSNEARTHARAHTHTRTHAPAHTHAQTHTHIQGVPRGMCQTSGVPYVKVYRYNPKHLCPKLSG